MSEFTDILTHARRLNAATKNLTSTELEEVLSKLQSVIAQRKEEESALAAEHAAKKAEIARIRKEIEAAGLNAEDILGVSATPAKATRKRAPKPPKYEYKDEQGVRQTWTGQGRAPKVIADAIKSGKRKEDFLIK
ncbi:MAG: H-NS histone family protein [Idiomarina sp.]|nr:H-NS histone family protein [Idiomarina sp.]